MSILNKRNIKLCLLFYIILLQLSIRSYSQQGSPFSISLNYLPAKTDRQPFLFNAQFSVNVLANKDTLIAGLIGTSFKYYQFNFQNDSLNLCNLYSWSVPITFIINASLNKYFALLVEPSLSSDFKDINTSGFRYNIAIFYLKKTSQNSSSGFGVAVSKRFSGFQIAPLWLVNLHFCKHWTLSGTIPFKSKISYEFGSKRQLGISLAANNYSFRLSRIDNNHFMDYQAIEASIFYQQPILKHFKWTINLGVQSTQTEAYSKNQTFPLGLFLLSGNKSENPIESFKNRGMFLFQMGVSYSPF